MNKTYVTWILTRSEEVCLLGEKQKKIISQLQAEKEGFQFTVSELQNEVIFLSSKLNSMTKSVIMLNKGSNMLDEVLQIGKAVGDIRGIGFKNKSLHSQGESSMTNFVLPGKESKSVMSKPLSQHNANYQNLQTKGRSSRGRCHYYGKYGHIKPFCFILYGYPRYLTQLIINQKKEWIPKTFNSNFIAQTFLRASARED